MRTIAVILAFFAGLSVASAQGFKDTLHLKEVVLTAERDKSVAKIIQLDSALKDYPSSTLAEILSRRSSVFIKTYGPGTLASPSFRGTNARQTKVFWNGLPVNSPMYGESDLNLIPVFVLSGASLKMGAGGIENGPGSFGGSIELSSRGGNEYNYAIVDQSAGSFSTFFTGLGVRYGSRKLWGDTKLYNAQSKNDFSYTDISHPAKPVVRLQNAAYRNRGIMQQAGSFLNERTILEGAFWLQEMNRELPTILLTKPQGETQDDRSIRANLRGLRYFNKASLEMNVNWSDEKQLYTNPRTGIFSNNDYRRGQGIIQYKRSVGKADISLGAESLLDMALTGNYHGTRQRLVLSLPVKLSYRPVQTLTIVLNARQEAVDRKLIPLIFNIATEWAALSQNRLNISLSGGKNYNYPTLNDLYWQPGGNPGLLPESGLMLEAGTSGKFSFSKTLGLEYRQTVFSNLIENQIQWLPGNTSYWIPQNLGEVWSRGAETEIVFAYDKAHTLVSWSNAYAYVRSTDLLASDAYKAQQLIYIPVHNFNSNLETQIRRNSFRLNYSFTGERQAFGGTLEGYHLLNVAIGREINFKSLRLLPGLRCDNLLDTEYQVIPWRPMPGRSFGININIKIK